MYIGQVIGFVESVHPRFPVRSPFGPHVMQRLHLLDLVALEIARRETERLGERRRTPSHVDENDAAANLAAQLAQPGAMRDERRRESVLVRYGLQPPVAVELPAMKRTG